MSGFGFYIFTVYYMKVKKSRNILTKQKSEDNSLSVVFE